MAGKVPRLFGRRVFGETGLGKGARVSARSPATASTVPPADPDFACAYAVAIAPGDGRSSEAWGRAVWEEAPAPLRSFVVVGWRFVLWLRLGPAHDADHILGWRIADRPAGETVCEARSGFLTAFNTFRVVDGTFVWSTFVSYEGPAARIVWPPASLLHRAIVRLSLRRAAVRTRT